GWQLDLQLVALFAPQLAAALGGSVDAARVVADFMAQFPNGTDATQAEVWLTSRGVSQQIANAILPVLQQMWLAAFEAGGKAANESAQQQYAASQQEYQDLLAQMQQNWLNQIAATTIALMATARAGAALTATALSAALTAALADAARATKIAI